MLSHRDMTRVIALVTALIGSSLLPHGVYGSSFQVYPIRVSFAPKETTTLLTVRNEAKKPLRLQIGVFAWDESRKGEMVLKPTDDIIFYPTLLSLNPGDQRNVRVGTNNQANGAKEKTYRIFFEEIPSEERPATTGIQLRTKIGIPIFIQPEKSTIKGLIDQLAMKALEFSFELKNEGNVHFQPRGIRVKAAGQNGDTVLERQLPGWYILAGQTREYRIEVSKSDCQKIKDLSVEVAMENKVLKEQLAPPAGACAR